MRDTGIPFIEKEPEKISDEDILRVHTPKYLNAIKTGIPRTLAESNSMKWSPRFAETAYLMAGGMYQSAKAALEDRIATNTAAGFHHALPERGLCFCTLNSFAIAIKKLQAEGKIKKAMVLDCDLHYGNGAARIFQEDDSVFTFSLYGKDIAAFPYEDTKTSKTIKLPSGTTGKEYLQELEKNIPKILAEFKPELIIYNAGADPHEDDDLSNLNLSTEDMAERDRLVFQMAKDNGVPITYSLGGGYNKKDFSKVIAIHRNTFVKAAEVFGLKKTS